MGNRDVDPAQGVSDFNARAFDAPTGRFAGMDPIEGDLQQSQTLNPYLHGVNNPYRWSDPTGLWPSFGDVLKFTASAVVPCYDLAAHYMGDSGSHDNTSWGALDKASAVAGCVPGVGKAGSLGLKAAKASAKVVNPSRFTAAVRNFPWEDVLASRITKTKFVQENPVACVATCGVNLAESIGDLRFSEGSLFKALEGGSKGALFSKLHQALGADKWKLYRPADIDRVKVLEQATSRGKGTVAMNMTVPGSDTMHAVLVNPRNAEGLWPVHSPGLKAGYKFLMTDAGVVKYGLDIVGQR